MSDAQLLRDTLELTLLKGDFFPRRFYERLFEKDPSLRQLFQRNSEGAQQKMFAQKLTAIVDGIEDSDYLQRELVAMSSSHRSYGVTADMYPLVGDALIETLREACGEAFTAEAEQAWRRAYNVLASAMAPR